MADEEDRWWERTRGPPPSRLEEVLEDIQIRNHEKGERAEELFRKILRVPVDFIGSLSNKPSSQRVWRDRYGRTIAPKYQDGPGRYDEWVRIDPETGITESVLPSGLTRSEARDKSGRVAHKYGDYMALDAADEISAKVQELVTGRNYDEGLQEHRTRSKMVEEEFPDEDLTALGLSFGTQATLPAGIWKWAIGKGAPASIRAAQVAPGMVDRLGRQRAMGQARRFGALSGAYSAGQSFAHGEGEEGRLENVPVDTALGVGLGAAFPLAPLAPRAARYVSGSPRIRRWSGRGAGAAAAGAAVAPNVSAPEPSPEEKVLADERSSQLQQQWDRDVEHWLDWRRQRRAQGGPVRMAGGGPLKFFSVLERAIKDSPQKKMSAEQWKNYLKPGREVRDDGVTYPLRQDELDFTRLDWETEPANPGRPHTPEEEARLRELERIPEEQFTSEMNSEFADIDSRFVPPTSAKISRLPLPEYLAQRGQEPLTAEDLLRVVSSTRDLPNFKMHGGNDRAWLEIAKMDKEMDAVSDMASHLSDLGWERIKGRLLSPDQRAMFEQLEAKDSLTPDEAYLREALAESYYLPQTKQEHADEVFTAMIEDGDPQVLINLGVPSSQANLAWTQIRNQVKQLDNPRPKFSQYVLPGDKMDYQEDTTWWHPTLKPGSPRVPDAEFTYQAPHTFVTEPFHSHGRGLLSWSRATDRKTADGQPVLVVEEIQSDLHQAGREGYRTRPMMERRDEISRQLRDLSTKSRKIEDEILFKPVEKFAREFPRPTYESYRSDSGEIDLGRFNADVFAWRKKKDEVYDLADAKMQATPEYREIQTKLTELRAEQSRLGNFEERPPEAPYSKTYAELELKKQLMHAIDNGQDLVAITTPKQQADRWQQALTEHIDEIGWVGHDRGEQGWRFNVQPRKGGQPAPVGEDRTHDLTEKELKNLVGSDVAKKIIDKANDWKSKTTGAIDDLGPRGSIQGTDITIGAQGMRHFYGSVVPEAMKKLAKQYGMEVTKVQLKGDDAGKNLFDQKVFFWNTEDHGPRPRVDWEHADPEAVETWAYEVLRMAGQQHPDLIGLDPHRVSQRAFVEGMDILDLFHDWPQKARDLIIDAPWNIQEAIWDVVNGGRSIPGRVEEATIELKSLLNELEKVAASETGPGQEMTALKITPSAKEKIKKQGMPLFAVPAAVGAASALQPDEAEAKGYAGGGIVRRLFDRLAGRTPEVKEAERILPDLPPLEPEPSANLPAVVESRPLAVELGDDLSSGLPELPVPEASRRGFLGILRKGAAAASMGPRAVALAEKLAPAPKPEVTPEQVYTLVRDQFTRGLRPTQFTGEIKKKLGWDKWHDRGEDTYADYFGEYGRGNFLRQVWGDPQFIPPEIRELVSGVEPRALMKDLRSRVEKKLGRPLEDEEWIAHARHALTQSDDEMPPGLERLSKRSRRSVEMLPSEDVRTFAQWAERNKHDLFESDQVRRVPMPLANDPDYVHETWLREDVDYPALYVASRTGWSLDKAARWLERRPDIEADLKTRLEEKLQQYRRWDYVIANGKDGTFAQQRNKSREARFKDLGLKKGGKVDFDPDGDGYDYDGAERGGLGPDDEDHWPSRRPLSEQEARELDLPLDSGVLLKGRQHPTWQLGIDADEKLGYRLIRRGRRYYTVKERDPGPHLGFAGGGQVKKIVERLKQKFGTVELTDKEKLSSRRGWERHDIEKELRPDLERSFPQIDRLNELRDKKSAYNLGYDLETRPPDLDETEAAEFQFLIDEVNRQLDQRIRREQSRRDKERGSPDPGPRKRGP